MLSFVGYVLRAMKKLLYFDFSFFRPCLPFGFDLFERLYQQSFPPSYLLLDFLFSLLLFCFLHGFFLYLFCFFLVFFHSFDHGFLFLPSFSVVLASLVGHYNLLHFGCWIDCCASHVCSVSSSVDHFCSLGHCWAGDVLQHWMWLPTN